MTEEFKKNKGLALVGGGINLTYWLTFFFWSASLVRILGSAEALCWPFFESCRSLRPFSPGVIQSLWWGLLVLPGLSIWFLYRKAYLRHLLFLALAGALKFFIFAQDYRFMGNYHWMPFWVTLVYLFSSSRVRDLRWLVVLFYFFAGTLKFSEEWLSGSALLISELPHPFSIQWLTSGVLFLEIVLVWFLLNPRWRHPILGVLFFFHLYSWQQVGYFYPLVMACLLTVFFIPDPKVSRRRFFSLGRGLLLLFIGVQVPSLLAGSASVLSGKSRYLSLNMFDAHSRCQGYAFYHQRQQWTHIPLQENLGVRIHCEPLVFWELARNRCIEYQDRELDGKLHLVLFSRKSTDREWTQMMDVQDVCSSPQRGHLFQEHDYLRVQPSEALRPGVFPRAVLRPSHSPSIEGVVEDIRPAAALGELTEQKSLGPWNVGKHTAAKSSPVGDASGFYVASDGGQLAKFNWDGEMLWRFVTQVAGEGIHGTPLLLGDSLYFGTYSGDFYRLDRQRGDVIWVRRMGDAIGASPTATPAGEILVNTEYSTVKKWGGLVLKLSAAGEVLWQSEDFPDQSHSTPVLSKDQVVFGSNDGKIRWLDLQTGHLQKQTALAIAPSKGRPLVGQGRVFITNWSQGLSALDEESGDILWSDPTGAIAMAAPVFSPEGKSVFYGSGNGELRELDIETGRLLRVFKLGERGLKSGLLVVGQELFLGCHDTSLCRVNVVTGKVQVYKLDGRVSAQPLLQGQRMIVSTEAPGGLWLLKFE